MSLACTAQKTGHRMAGLVRLFTSRGNSIEEESARSEAHRRRTTRLVAAASAFLGQFRAELSRHPRVTIGLVLLVAGLASTDLVEMTPLDAALRDFPFFRFLHESHDIVAVLVALYAAYKWRTSLGAAAMLVFMAAHGPYFYGRVPQELPELLRLLLTGTMGLFGVHLIGKMRQQALETLSLAEAEQARIREMETLFNIASILVQPGTLEERAKRVMEEVVRVGQADRAVLRVPDERGQGLRLLCVVGTGSDDRTPALRPYGESISSEAFQAQGPVLANDYASHPKAMPTTVEIGIKSALALPIRVRGRILGVFTVSSLKASHFNPQRVTLLSAIADGMGAPLENARLLEAEQTRIQEMEALYNIASILVQLGSLEERLKQVMDEVLRVSHVDRAVLRVYDEMEHGLRFVAEASSGVSYYTPSLRSPAEGISGKAFQEGRPVIANDFASHPQALPTALEAGMRSAIALPIRVQGRTLGVFTALSLKANHFNPQRVVLLSTIADGMGALLENARLFQEVSSTLESTRRRVEALRQAAEQLALQALPEHSLHQMVSLVRDLVGARYGALVIWGAEDTVDRFIVSGISPEEQRRIGAPPMNMGLLKALREGKSLRLADVASNPRSRGFPPHHPIIKTLLAVPVLSGRSHAGALLLGEKEGASEFSEDDERLLGLFAIQTGVFLDNMSLYADVARERSTLEAIQASMTDGLAVLDRDGRVLYCNQSATALVELADGEVLGRTVNDIIRKLEGSFEIMGESSTSDLLAALRDPGEAPATFEVRMLQPQPRELLLTVFPIPVEPETKRMTGILIRDMTEEREVDRRRDDFVSIASHELRTPMTSLVGFTEILLQRAELKNPHRRWLERVHTESMRLTEIVDDLLNVSRIQSGKLSTRQESVDLQEVAEESLAHIRPTTEKHGFYVDIPPGIPSPWVDRDKLCQVLVNLLDNAVKYSPGGGPITIAAHHEPERERVVMSIADRGIGIGPEDTERLFTTFHRIHRPETAGVRGTGLGLYIVKALLEMMHGEVWLESELDHGTTFFLSLPLLRAQGTGSELPTLPKGGQHAQQDTAGRR